MHPKLKKPMFYTNTKPMINKYIIRKSFEINSNINEKFLWRTHSNIIESMNKLNTRLNDYFNQLISDSEYNNLLSNLRQKTQYLLPTTKEELYYRNIFEKYYPNRAYLVSKFWSTS